MDKCGCVCRLHNELDGWLDDDSSSNGEFFGVRRKTRLWRKFNAFFHGLMFSLFLAIKEKMHVGSF